MTDEKKTWWDKLDTTVQAILLAGGTPEQEQQMLDPDKYWDVSASELADELREAVVDLPIGAATLVDLLKLASRIGRLDGRAGTTELREWKQGARDASVIAHRSHEGRHTADFYLVHQQRYMASAAVDGAYAAGADCVASAILASKREKSL